MGSAAETLVASGELPDVLYPAAEAVANQLARDLAVWATITDEGELARRPVMIHAYRYEVLADGSVVALYALESGVRESGPVVLAKAFPDMAAASRWTPRNEYAGWRHEAPGAAPPDGTTFTFGGGQ